MVALSDYLVTATCSTETNLSASATIYVGRVNIDGDFYQNGSFADDPAGRRSPPLLAFRSRARRDEVHAATQ